MERRRKQTPDRSYEMQCLQLLLGIFADSGLSVDRIRAVSNTVLDGLKGSRRRWNPADLYYFDRLAHILSLWHLRRGYVDSNGSPRPLALYARGPSLSKLIRIVYPLDDPAEILSTLVRVGAVYAVGSPLARRWVPTGRALVFKSPRVARLRILSDLIHFLGTAQYNVTHSNGKLLQRSAFNPAVPVRDLVQVDRRAWEAAQTLLIEHDAELERRAQSASRSARTAGTGLGIYAYRAIRWTAGPPSPIARQNEKKRPKPP